ncbi:MAG: hypothetical protein PHW96_01615 [Candidatus Nanoarchaeia archaeon]|nr:hypothetical protein [Candidatus Nanoarchaeia archaeon]
MNVQKNSNLNPSELTRKLYGELASLVGISKPFFPNVEFSTYSYYNPQSHTIFLNENLSFDGLKGDIACELGHALRADLRGYAGSFYNCASDVRKMKFKLPPENEKCIRFTKSIDCSEFYDFLTYLLIIADNSEIKAGNFLMDYLHFEKNWLEHIVDKIPELSGTNAFSKMAQAISEGKKCSELECFAEHLPYFAVLPCLIRKDIVKITRAKRLLVDSDSLKRNYSGLLRMTPEDIISYTAEGIELYLEQSVDIL